MMESELASLNDRWSRAWLERDSATVERMMADDYVYVAPNGTVLDHRAIMGIIGSPSYRLDRTVRTEVIVRPIGADAAIIRHRSQSAGAYEGVAFEEDHRGVMVWARMDGEWRIVLEQHSSITSK
jgi:hypothetical protein